MQQTVVPQNTTGPDRLPTHSSALRTRGVSAGPYASFRADDGFSSSPWLHPAFVCNVILFEFRGVLHALGKLSYYHITRSTGGSGETYDHREGLVFLVYIGSGNIKPFSMFLVMGDTISKSMYVSLRMTNLLVCLAKAMTRKDLHRENLNALREIIREPYVPQRSMTFDDSPGIIKFSMG